ncbi:zinc finger protein [Striga asiatica]|uniref:Zinc finger protein n=1 Tax=Striga asiatica TaxID=4170 RepID=A0A5A7RKF7_STRAF|nr:zinc finger protein [Striga asiatica]
MVEGDSEDVVVHGVHVGEGGEEADSGEGLVVELVLAEGIHHGARLRVNRVERAGGLVGHHHDGDDGHGAVLGCEGGLEEVDGEGYVVLLTDAHQDAQLSVAPQVLDGTPAQRNFVPAGVVHETAGAHDGPNLDDTCKHHEQRDDPQRPQVDLEHIRLEPACREEGRVQELPNWVLEPGDDGRSQGAALRQQQAQHKRPQHKVLPDSFREQCGPQHAHEEAQDMPLPHRPHARHLLRHAAHEWAQPVAHAHHEREGRRHGEGRPERVVLRLYDGEEDADKGHPEEVTEHGCRD